MNSNKDPKDVGSQTAPSQNDEPPKGRLIFKREIIRKDLPVRSGLRVGMELPPTRG